MTTAYPTAPPTAHTTPGAPTKAATVEPRWLSTDEQHTWRLFLGATNLLTDQLDRELQAGAVSMPMSYYEILVRLSEAPDRRMRMSELAGLAQSSRSRLSHAVARLEEQGWVKRVACPTDKRGAFAVLTDVGFAALAQAAPGHVESVRLHLFDRLTPEQVQQLTEISRAVLTPLAEQRPGGIAGCPLS